MSRVRFTAWRRFSAFIFDPRGFYFVQAQFLREYKLVVVGGGGQSSLSPSPAVMTR